MRGALVTARRAFGASFGPLLIGSALSLIPFCYLSYALLLVTLDLEGGGADALSLPLQAAVLVGWAGVLAVVQAGFAHVGLRAEAGEQPGVRDFFRVPNAVKAIATGWFANVLVLVGVFLFILPGLLTGLWCLFAVTVAVDRGLGPWRAIRSSASLVSRNPFSAILIGLAVAVLIFIGVLLLGPLGLLMLFAPVVLAAPLVALALVNAYRALESAESR